MNHKSVLSISFVLTLFISIFGYSYTRIFPYKFSTQRHFESGEINGVYDSTQTTGVFLNQPVESEFIDNQFNPSQVLGTQDPSVKKHIEVDLSTQTLYAKENDQTIATFPVSTGKWGRTPTGTFKIWIKLKATKMEGGSKALGTYYYLPNVPYTMFFYNDEIEKSRGYGIHGAYWHSNFGVPMSHGCINMRTRDVEKLYYWAGPDTGDKNMIHSSEQNPGTEIIIYGDSSELEVR